MILPDKNIKLEYSLLNCGALILKELSEPQTISLLWDKVKKYDPLINYERFLLTLDFLFLIRAIAFSDGLIVRYTHDSFDQKQ